VESEVSRDDGIRDHELDDDDEEEIDDESQMDVDF
jgi:hypothetical protein